MRSQRVSAGEAIRALRQIAGLTLQDVAEGADTAIAYLSKVERGTLVPADTYVARVTTFIAAEIATKSERAA